IFSADGILTYAQMQAQVDKVAYVLTHDMGLVRGNRVLLRSANNAMLAICWCAVAKTGLIVVATMPLLREKELVDIIEKVQISAAICDRRLDAELQAAQQRCPVLEQIMYFNDPSTEGLEARMSKWNEPFIAVDAAAVLLEKLTPESLLSAISEYHATIAWSTPLFYRQMAEIASKFDISTLRQSVSAGEWLPVSTRTMWCEATGIEMVDGIGST